MRDALAYGDPEVRKLARLAVTRLQRPGGAPGAVAPPTLAAHFIRQAPRSGS